MQSHKRQLDEYHARRTMSPEPLRKVKLKYDFFLPIHQLSWQRRFENFPGDDRRRCDPPFASRGPIVPPPNHPLGLTRAMRNWANFIRALWD